MAKSFHIFAFALLVFHSCHLLGSGSIHDIPFPEKTQATDSRVIPDHGTTALQGPQPEDPDSSGPPPRGVDNQSSPS